MRRAAALALILFAASPAFAAPKPRRPIPPAPAPVAETPPPAAPAALPRLGITPLRLTGLPTRSDPGPACRSQCSQRRYTCSGDDDASDCSQTWMTCLATCRAP